MGHEISINANHYLLVDENLIPTGSLARVTDTPMDFLQARTVVAQIDKVGNGYDHCYALNKAKDRLSLAAQVRDPQSGRSLEVHTTQPGLQFYTGSFLDSTFSTQGVPHVPSLGFCLEAQHFPDSPNQPAFPTTTLRPEDVYSESILHRFSVIS